MFNAELETAWNDTMPGRIYGQRTCGRKSFQIEGIVLFNAELE